MRLSPLVFALGLLFCLCNGAPPKEVGSGSTSRVYFKFTEEEDNFLIQELLRIQGDSVPILGKALWEHIEEKHRLKWRQKTSGFPCERKSKALRERLIKTLIYNHPHAKVKLPESLLLKFPILDKKNRNRAPRQLYTLEEERLIVKELLKPSYSLVYGSSTWQAIKKNHDAKRQQGCPGFEKERSAISLRSHMDTMKLKGLLPNEVLKKFPSQTQAGNSSTSTTPRGKTVPQDTNEDLDDDEWVASLLQEPADDMDEPI